MKILHKLDSLRSFISRRQAGHTNAMLKGAENTEKAIIVALNEQHAQDLENRGVKNRIVSVSQLGNRGPYFHSGPVLLDHVVVWNALSEAIDEIGSQKTRIEHLALHASLIVGAIESVSIEVYRRWFVKGDEKTQVDEFLKRVKSEIAALRNKLKESANDNLRALCLTRDYVGDQLLPAVEGWEWYDQGKKLADRFPELEWAEQFRHRTKPCEECGESNPRHTEECSHFERANPNFEPRKPSVPCAQFAGMFRDKTKPLDPGMDNVIASRMGEVAMSAGSRTRTDVGDNIDRGLILLRLLKEQGLSVIISPEDSDKHE